MPKHIHNVRSKRTIFKSQLHSTKTIAIHRLHKQCTTIEYQVISGLLHVTTEFHFNRGCIFIILDFAYI